ncbi:MAG: hypothetical protein KF752_19540 [Pirellulaceae bacterium]|nr:hypothetical protein [Pirellulaceae bacterium]
MLILLNVELQRGIIGPKQFSLLVVMAIITTVAASPIIAWIRPRSDQAEFYYLAVAWA